MNESVQNLRIKLDLRSNFPFNLTVDKFLWQKPDPEFLAWNTTRTNRGYLFSRFVMEQPQHFLWDVKKVRSMRPMDSSVVGLTRVVFYFSFVRTLSMSSIVLLSLSSLRLWNGLRALSNGAFQSNSWILEKMEKVISHSFENWHTYQWTTQDFIRSSWMKWNKISE